MHVRALVMYIIEPVALHRNVAYHEFFNSIKFTILPKSLEYDCQLHELMFQAGVKGM